MGAAGLPVDTRTEEGVPSQVIADMGRAHDLIVMGKRGEHAKWGRDLLGSTAENVARRSATPVLLVETAYRPLAKALVHVRRQQSGQPGAEAGRRPCDPHRSRPEGAHGGRRRRPGVGPLRSRPRPIWGHSGSRRSTLVSPGGLRRWPPALLAKEPVDVVIMGMRGHSVLHDLILGSTAEQLMRSVEFPILLVP